MAKKKSGIEKLLNSVSLKLAVNVKQSQKMVDAVEVIKQCLKADKITKKEKVAVAIAFKKMEAAAIKIDIQLVKEIGDLNNKVKASMQKRVETQILEEVGVLKLNPKDFNCLYKTKERTEVSELNLTGPQKAVLYSYGYFIKRRNGKGKNNWKGFAHDKLVAKMNLQG